MPISCRYDVPLFPFRDWTHRNDSSEGTNSRNTDIYPTPRRVPFQHYISCPALQISFPVLIRHHAGAPWSWWKVQALARRYGRLHNPFISRLFERLTRLQTGGKHFSRDLQPLDKDGNALGLWRVCLIFFLSSQNPDPTKPHSTRSKGVSETDKHKPPGTS